MNKIVLVLAMVLPTVLLFQNCQKPVKFGNSQTENLASKGSSGILAPVQNDSEDDVSNEPIVPVPPIPPKDDADPDAQSGPMDHVCILEGSGSSVKLGLANESAAGQTSGSQTLCMSIHACVDIASKAFDVKFAQPRGYCKSIAEDSAELRAISDAEMRDLIDSILGH